MPDLVHPIRILHLEDNPRDAELIQRKLETGGLVCEVVLVRDGRHFETALAQDGFDLILCDYNLPGYDGLTALKLAREKQPDARVILVSGTLGEDEAVRCLHLGAADYLLKQRLERLAPAVRRALEEAAELGRRRQAEWALRESEANYRALIEHMGEGLIRVDLDDIIRFVNPQLCRMSGYSEADLLGQHASNLLIREEDRAAIGDRVSHRELGVILGYEIQLRKRSGELFWTWISAAPLTGPDGRASGSMATVADITERKRAEDALRRSRDLLDSTGQLARIGGWELDVESETLTWTDEVYRIHDLEPGTKFKVTEAIDFYAPEARPVIAAAVRDAIDSGTPWDLELPLITARGRRLWVRAQGSTVRHGGRTVRLHGAFQDITERKRAELAAAEAARSLESLLANLPGYMYRAVNDPDYTVELISEGVNHITGYAPHEFLAGRTVNFGELILPEDQDEVWRVVQEAVAAREPFEFEYRVRTRSGEVKWLWERGRGFYGPSGELLYLEGFVTDITARRETEQMLLQAQKLEAIGQLAGGVAHDFNNMLGVIIGYGEMAKRQLDPGHPARERIDRMVSAAEQSAELTRQLLTFSRKQELQPRPLDLNTLVTDTKRMLGRLIGANIHVVLHQAPDLGTVKADPGKIGQVIMNLAVNARDAMPEGGSLTLETANVDLDVVPGEAHPIAEPVRYVMLAVSDTGVGMDEATQNRIFEPFFTTKAEGMGTGLGLATVYGIVKQSGGHIRVYSEPGHGTSFKVYLPRIDEPAETARPASPPAEALSGHETILLVEDTEILREMISESLEERGYTVLTASDGEDALALAGEHQGPIDLLLTDVVMPKLGGGELAKRLSESQPGLRVVYISGYTGGTIEQHGVTGEGVLLEKPFTVDTLARVLRECLDR